jgi:hypothetical protein
MSDWTPQPSGSAHSGAWPAPWGSPFTPIPTRLSGDGIKVAAFALGQPSLDEVFLALTGRSTQTTDNEQEAA